MDLNNLTPSEIASLKAQLLGGPGGTDPSGRSPLKPRQLHDLRLMPTANDPRPMFIPSAETPRDWIVGPGTPYPRLMWHTVTGEERTVHTKDEQCQYEGEWTVDPPVASAPNPMADLAEALEQLTADERALVVQAQQADRMKAIQAKLAAMSPEQVEALLAGHAVPTAKRGPGRPKKAVA